MFTCSAKIGPRCCRSSTRRNTVSVKLINNIPLWNTANQYACDFRRAIRRKCWTVIISVEVDIPPPFGCHVVTSPRFLLRNRLLTFHCTSARSCPTKNFSNVWNFFLIVGYLLYIPTINVISYLSSPSGTGMESLCNLPPHKDAITGPRSIICGQRMNGDKK